MYSGNVANSSNWKYPQNQFALPFLPYNSLINVRLEEINKNKKTPQYVLFE